jgi:AbiJ N-terminal domain 4
MAIIDVFSKRQKVLRKEVPDVYEYAQIPQTLRVQIVHIMRDLFGRPTQFDVNGCLEMFGRIEELLSREYGRFNLGTTMVALSQTADERVIDFLLKEEDHERVLDVVEVSFRLVSYFLKTSFDWQKRVSKEKFDSAVTELNARFREHGIGYQYESGEIIRVDSQLIHAEVVKPALALLAAKEYAGANAEFLKAFGHYRKGETKDCLSECLKAFESTMKAICTKRKWAFKPTDAAKELIDVCLKNDLIPPLIQSHIGGVRAALESGIPTVRNRTPGSGHGQGPKVVTVPPHYASFMLHLTATNIKFLVESEQALP